MRLERVAAVGRGTPQRAFGRWLVPIELEVLAGVGKTQTRHAQARERRQPFRPEVAEVIMLRHVERVLERHGGQRCIKLQGPAKWSRKPNPGRADRP